MDCSERGIDFKEGFKRSSPKKQQEFSLWYDAYRDLMTQHGFEEFELSDFPSREVLKIPLQERGLPHVREGGPRLALHRLRTVRIANEELVAKLRDMVPVRLLSHM